MTQVIQNWSVNLKHLEYFENVRRRGSFYLTIKGRAPFGNATVTVRGRVGDRLVIAGQELFELGNQDPSLPNKIRDRLFSAMPEINQSPI